MFEVTDRKWRGVGAIPKSGYRLRREYRAHDAERVFEVEDIETRESAVCISGLVLRGVKKPLDCPAFAQTKPLPSYLVALAVGKFAFVPIEGMGVPGRVVGIELEEHRVPVREDVRGACEILGFDPLYVANEGKLVAFVSGAAAERVLEAMHGHALGGEAVRIGTVTDAHPGLVVVRTGIGGSRVLEKPYGELLPRIC